MGAFTPTKEGDEFGGVDQGSMIGLVLNEWVALYAEVLLLMTVIAMCWPLLFVPGAMYWGWKKLESSQMKARRLD